MWKIVKIPIADWLPYPLLYINIRFGLRGLSEGTSDAMTHYSKPYFKSKFQAHGSFNKEVHPDFFISRDFRALSGDLYSSGPQKR